MNFFGLEIAMIGYQGTVFPVLLAVWFMSLVEKQLRRAIPDALDLILTPFLTVIISGFIALLIIGPAGRALGDGISFVLSTLISPAGWLAGLLFGGLYSVIVITGIHHSFHAIEAGLLGNPSIGVNFLLPIWSMANVAQGGACLAVWFKTKDVKIKAIALPSAFFRYAGHHRGGDFWYQLTFHEAVYRGADRRRGGRRVGRVSARLYERSRPDGDSRHGYRAGQLAAELHYRYGHRLWRRFRRLSAAEIQNGR
ncbi:PTS system protein [Klebsiella grimontii]|uniref:PTS system protein n=1 Tax=Klebsiella grimontii TaxID=2058152 RepID=A0A7H4P8F2_9ENTR|nr:PTS system protein [Klebsiella grimontii]